MYLIVRGEKYFLDEDDGKVNIYELEKTYWRVKCKDCGWKEAFLSLTMPVLQKCRHCSSESLVFRNFH